MSAGSALSYRPEIDGLRAVAVVPVILFHAGFSFFSGGFVGVDIFFVISGYLITAIILSELEKGDFSLVRFYERRARRILPALFVVMACCIPFAWLWMEPYQYKSFGRSLAAMALFGSNFLFWSGTDYFAAAAEEKPLLHTWSLSVEEQFYLLFPLLLLLLWRFERRRLLIVIAGLAAASLVLSEFAWRYAPAANFYLAPTRVWELCGGAMCAFALARGRLAVSAPMSNLLSLAGLGMVLAALLLFTEETPIPSFYALVPVGGTCLIILFANPSSWTTRILATRLLVGIGLISYSIYLWHQPLLAFARIRLPYDQSSALLLSLSALSIVLAYLTWRFVEKPFRHGRAAPLVTQRQMFGLAAAAGCLLIAAAFTSNKNYYFSVLPQKAAYYEKFSKYAEDTKKNAHWGNCNSTAAGDTIDPDCLRVDRKKKNYLLIGDSHAAHWSRAIHEAFPDDNILQATALNCRTFSMRTGIIRCDEFFEGVFNDFLPHHKIDGVVLSARWRKNGAHDLDEVLARISKYVKRIVVLGPTMVYQAKLPNILRDYERFGEDVTAGVSSRHIDLTRYDVNEIVRDTARRNGAEFVDVLSVQCPDKRCRAVTANDEPASYDNSHLTLTSSRELMATLAKSGRMKLSTALSAYR